jgi:hypothetical protein
MSSPPSYFTGGLSDAAILKGLYASSNTADKDLQSGGGTYALTPGISALPDRKIATSCTYCAQVRYG